MASADCPVTRRCQLAGWGGQGGSRRRRGVPRERPPGRLPFRLARRRQRRPQRQRRWWQRRVGRWWGLGRGQGEWRPVGVGGGGDPPGARCGGGPARRGGQGGRARGRRWERLGGGQRWWRCGCRRPVVVARQPEHPPARHVFQVVQLCRRRRRRPPPLGQHGAAGRRWRRLVDALPPPLLDGAVDQRAARLCRHPRGDGGKVPCAGRRQGVVAPLRTHPGAPAVVDAACRVLLALTIHDAAAADEVLAADGVAAVLACLVALVAAAAAAALSPPPPGATTGVAAATSAIKALRNLTQTAAHREAIVDGGGIESVVAAMGAFAADARLASHGCLVLSNLTFGSAAAKDRVGVAGGLDAIAGAMLRHPDYQPVAARGSLALATCCTRPTPTRTGPASAAAASSRRSSGRLSTTAPGSGRWHTRAASRWATCPTSRKPTGRPSSRRVACARRSPSSPPTQIPPPLPMTRWASSATWPRRGRARRSKSVALAASRRWCGR